MARVTDKQIKKLIDKCGFRASLARPTPKWSPGSRKAKATARAWTKHLEQREEKKD